ncbi:MAG: DNA helicase [Gemmatimonadota bacterium]|jgi:hypothetical protein|nr:DNA helicase [Gemmatimonadota bacterium]
MSDLRTKLHNLRALIREFNVGPHRRSLARAKREEDDLFMLLVFSEMMGIPNPASYYMLELQPVLWERFHNWHTHMGMKKSPLDGIPCC